MAKTGGIEDFEMKEELGRGSFAVVYRAIRKSDRQEFAVKQFDRKSVTDGAANLSREIDILKRVRHPGIIALEGHFETKDKIFLVMELVTGGELFDAIAARGQFTENEAATVTRQMVDAVAYLHEQGIVHRDLKPENLLLRSNDPSKISVAIADFGFSKLIGEGATTMTACGSPIYVAPEVLRAEGYGKPVDVWAVGVISYLLLAGFPPFMSEQTAEMFDMILSSKQEYPEDYFGQVSAEAKSFIDACLTKNPAERITAAAAQKHPWLNGKSGTSAMKPDRIKSFVLERQATRSRLKV